MRPTFTARAFAAALSLAAPLAAAADDADTVIATVAGRAITLGDLIAVRAELPAQYQMLPDEILYDGIRQQLVDQTLLGAAAEEAGLDDDPAVRRMLEMQRTMALGDLHLRRILAERVTDEALAEAYRARFLEAEPVPEVRAAHILVDSAEKAADLIRQLEAGADFAALAAEHGTDGARARGGDLGWFSRDMMVEPFADAAFAAEPGVVAGPVETQFGWHVVLVSERRDRPAPAFEEVREELVRTLTGEVAQETMAALRAAATVETPEGRPGLGALRDDSLLPGR